MTNFRKNTIATLAVVLFSQSLFASYTPSTTETLDVTAFSSVWSELYKHDEHNKEDLQETLSSLLENETLDVTKFSSVWNDLYRNEQRNKEDLKITISNLLENTVATVDESCIESDDLMKLSSL